MRIRIQALMMQGEFGKADALFKKSFGSEPSLQLLALENDLKAKRQPQALLIAEPRDGIAEIFFSVAQILSSEQNDDYTLVHARLAEYLLRESAEATLLSAEVLSNMEQFDPIFEVSTLSKVFKIKQRLKCLLSGLAVQFITAVGQ